MPHPRASFANVISCLALFVALGGASYAAVALPKNSVGTKQIKSSSIDNTKVKKGSLLKSSFKRGQLPKGAKGAKGAKGLPGVAGVGIKLAADSHYLAGDVAGDSQWHDYIVVKFTAAANTLYAPNQYSDYRTAALTGPDCGGTTSTLISRTVENGVDISPADANGQTYPPQILGPYPAGTAVTLQMQLMNTCSTQSFHSPAGEFTLVPYLTP